MESPLWASILFRNLIWRWNLQSVAISDGISIANSINDGNRMKISSPICAPFIPAIPTCLSLVPSLGGDRIPEFYCLRDSDDQKYKSDIPSLIPSLG